MHTQGIASQVVRAARPSAAALQVLVVDADPGVLERLHRRRATPDLEVAKRMVVGRYGVFATNFQEGIELHS